MGLVTRLHNYGYNITPGVGSVEKDSVVAVEGTFSIY